MWYILNDAQLLFVMILPVSILLIVFVYVLHRNSEARTYIKTWLLGGVITHDCDDAGHTKPLRLKQLGEGSYMGGKDKFSKRRIFSIPRINNPFITKRFISEGIGCPVFFNYRGKTVMVNAETLAAIEVAETKDKDNLPEPIRKWAKETNIPLRILKELQTAPGGEKASKQEVVDEEVELFSLDPRQLRYYFREHYDESPYDALLTRKEAEGYEAGRSGKGMEKILIAGAVCLFVGCVVLLVLANMGVI